MLDILPGETKRCSKCRTVRSVLDFHRNRALPDGYAAWCKHCVRAYHENRTQSDTFQYVQAKRRRLQLSGLKERRRKLLHELHKVEQQIAAFEAA